MAAPTQSQAQPAGATTTLVTTTSYARTIPTILPSGTLSSPRHLLAAHPGSTLSTLQAVDHLLMNWKPKNQLLPPTHGGSLKVVRMH